MATEADSNYEAAGFVISSEYRKEILIDLDSGPAIPTEMAEETGIEVAHVSRALTELREQGLVDLLVEEDRRKGRIYGLTDQGESVVDVVEDLS